MKAGKSGERQAKVGGGEAAEYMNESSTQLEGEKAEAAARIVAGWMALERAHQEELGTGAGGWMREEYGHHSQRRRRSFDPLLRR